MRVLRWLQRWWRAVRGPFLFLRPLRFVVIPLVILVWGLFASAQGQDTLCAVIEWSDCPHPWRTAWFIVSVAALAMQAWYWSRQLLLIDFPQCRPMEEPGETLAAAPVTTPELAERFDDTQIWVPRLLGASAFVIAIAAVARTAFRYGGGFDRTSVVALGTCLVLLVLLIAFLGYTVARRKKLGPYVRVPSHLALTRLTRGILAVTLGLSALFVLLTIFSPLSVGAAFPSPVLLMFSAAIWIGLGSWIVYWADRFRVPIVGLLLALAIVFSPINDNHAVRKVGEPIAPATLAARPRVAEAFLPWYARLNKKYGEGQPVFVVATEGGGIRAAYWTAAVLTALQDASPRFAEHVFAISGVSGGSVGASVFTALVTDPKTARPACDAVTPLPGYRFAAQQILSYDFLAPTLASLLHADLVQRFLPIGLIPDRAKALETGWERGWERAMGDHHLADGLLDTYAHHRDELVPSLFLNGTSVETGKRVITSNCRIDPNEIQEADDLFAQLGSDQRISTAAHSSARFTYVSPAGTIHCPDCDRVLGHVVDGGYFEDSGAQTAMDVIRTISNSAAHPGNVHLIIIRFEDRPPKPVPPEAFMNEVLSPLRGILNTRGARAELAVAQARSLGPTVQVHEFVLVQTKHSTVLPLGWLLAERTRRAIDVQVGTIDPPAELPKPIYDQAKTNVAMVRGIAKLLQPAPAAADRVQGATIQGGSYQ